MFKDYRESKPVDIEMELSKPVDIEIELSKPVDIEMELSKPVDIEIEVSDLENTCVGCPTIYDFKDKEGTNYHFRLRHGFARLVCEDTDEVLISDSMLGFDGVCGWDDFVEWSRNHGVLIND